jgi:endonuclease/exonuclease/phosphatase family metal-dependent hydrolase
MKIASFNVENLFNRARALNMETWAEGKPILEAHAKLNQLLQNPVYSQSDKTKMLALIDELGLTKSDTGRFVILRQNHGRLLTRHSDGTITIEAGGREDWIGWVELRKEPVNDRAIMNTGRVIRDVNADILAVIEAEDRTALSEFSKQVLTAVSGEPYRHVMLIDGNDERGIDVGLLTRDGFEIDLMRSHVDDVLNGSRIFSRDCPEFHLKTPTGESLWVLVNHFKSKGFGTASASNARRKEQATRVAEIYNALRGEGAENVVIVGDLNDTPSSGPLSPLLTGTDIKDVSEHDTFDDAGFPGTYGGATASNKIDYILLSPALFGKVTAGGVFRKGAWPGKRPKKWEVYPELEKEIHAASDHMAIWAQIEL